MIRHRSFWIILIITAVIGLSSVMSERNDYPLQLRIGWAGFDPAANVVEYADTVLPVVINSNCFLAIGRYFDAPRHRYIIQTTGDTVVNVNKLLLDDIVNSFHFPGHLEVTSVTETLSLRLSKRCGKAYRPELRDVEFRFDEQHGLSGEPVMSPDTVWLYGTASSLSEIDHLYTLPSVIEGLSDSGYYTLSLAPVWQKYPDMQVSHEEVRIFLPVERFTEKTISVPVRFVCPDNQVRARLYPERVDVSFWVSVENYDRLLDDMVQAEVVYNPDENPSTLPVRIRKFPSFARVKTVSPTNLQYVVIVK